MEGILDQIEYRHPQVTFARQHPRFRGVQLPVNDNASLCRIPVQQRQRFLNGLIHRYNLRLRAIVYAQFEQSARNPDAAVDFLVNQYQVIACLRMVLVAWALQARDGIERQADRGQGVIDFMGDTGGQPPKFRQFLLV